MEETCQCGFKIEWWVSKQPKDKIQLQFNGNGIQLTIYNPRVFIVMTVNCLFCLFTILLPQPADCCYLKLYRMGKTKKSTKNMTS